MDAPEITRLDKKEVIVYVSDIVSKLFNSNIVSVKYMGGGSYGMAYKVKQDVEPYIVVSKIYKVKKLNQIEANDLRVLSEHTNMKYPEVYYVFDATKECPVDCLCMEYISGKNALSSLSLLLKSRKKKRAFAEKIVDSMLEIHSHTNEKFGPINNPIYDNWVLYYKDFANDVLSTAKGMRDKLDNYIIDTMQEAYDNFDIIFQQEVTEASLIHGDLNVMNIMVDSKTCQPTAIIDPLEARYADREYDLFQLNNLTGKCFGLYKMYKEKFQTSKYCDIKCAFYGLYNEAYVYLKTGAMIKLLMNPLVRNMKKQLKKI